MTDEKPLLAEENKKEDKSITLFWEIMNTGFPLAVQTLATTINNIGNTIIFSNIRPKDDYAAAAAVIFVIQSTLNITLCGFFYRLNSVTKKGYSKENIIVNAFILAILLGILFGLGLSFSIAPVFLLLNTDKKVVDIINEYYTFFPIGLTFYFLTTATYQLSFVTFSNHIQKYSHFNQLNIKLAAINIIFNFIFNLIFIVFFHLPALGPAKIMSLNFALSNIIKWLVNMYNFRDCNIQEAFFVYSCFKTIVSEGISVCIQIGSDLVEYMLLPILSLWLLGNNTKNLRTLNVMTQCLSLSQTAGLVLGQTAMRLVGEKCEKKEYNKTLDYVNPLLISGVVFNLAWIILGVSIPNILMQIFHGPDESRHSGLNQNFRAMFALQFLLTTPYVCRYIICFSSRIVNISRVFTHISMANLALGLSLAIGLSKAFGVSGLVLGPAISECLFGLVAVNIWRQLVAHEGIKKRYETKNNKEIDSLWYFFSRKNSDYEKISLGADDENSHSNRLLPA